MLIKNRTRRIMHIKIHVKKTFFLFFREYFIVYLMVFKGLNFVVAIIGSKKRRLYFNINTYISVINEKRAKSSSTIIQVRENIETILTP